jgi:hypothetical protein
LLTARYALAASDLAAGAADIDAFR